MANVHFPIESFGISESEYQSLLSQVNPDQLNKLLGFRESFRQLHSKVNSGRITLSEFYSRAGKVSTRFKNFAERVGSNVTARIVKKVSDSNLRRRVPNNLEEGEEIELFNRGEVGPSYGTAGADIELGTEVGGISAVGSSSLTPLVAVGTGAVTVAGGAALLGKAYKSGIQVPGTNYVGPGNPIDSGAPTSFVDADAREHDISYSRDDTDIAASDTITANKFGDHFIESGDITGLIGNVGLNIKKNIEGHTGQLYPSK